MTRLYNSVLRQQLFYITKKTNLFRDSFPGMIAILLLGFLSGNLFGTLLNFLRNFVIWDGFVVASCLIVIEAINYMCYKPHSRTRFGLSFFLSPSFFQLWRANRLRSGQEDNASENDTTVYFSGKPNTPKPTIPKSSSSKRCLISNRAEAFEVVRPISFFKVGVMIGFFVDAFKVGS